MELAFVLARRQNTFFREIVDAIRDELDQAGVDSSLSLEGFPPPRDDLAYVLIPPHEWWALDAHRHRPTRAQLARTVFICAEQPGTAFFDDDVALAAYAGAVLDVSLLGIREFARRGVAGVRHFPLGWTRTWSHCAVGEDGAPVVDGDERDIDVLHLGIYSDRRARALAAGGAELAQWRTHLVLSDHDVPNWEPKANYATDERKWDLLRRSRVLLNIHVADRAYFEWQRIVQGMCNGCAVVTEHSTGDEPLRDGEHFVGARADAVGLVASGLLHDESLRASIAAAGYTFLRDELPLARSVTTLLEAAEEALASARTRTVSSDEPRPKLVAPSRHDEEAAEAAVTEFPSTVASGDASVVRAALKDVRLELLDIRRELARAQLEARRGAPVPAVEVLATTPAYAAAAPRISVVTPVYNHAAHITAALESAARQEARDIELVIVDDGSTDETPATVLRFLREHGGTPAVLIRHPVNRGLGPARNTGVDFARGELAFMLDADNVVYRRGLARLAWALDSDQEAAFSYGMLCMWDAEGPVGMRSVFPWRPDRLRTGTFVDAMALWRRAALTALGGYTTDRRLHGWEDYELWCRAAEAGLRGTMFPGPVAHYRVSRHSMLAVTDLSNTSAVSVLIERYPRLFAGVRAPL